LLEKEAVKETVFKDEPARIRMENWYNRFLQRAGIKTQSEMISTSFGDSHVLLAGNASAPPLVCLHAMMTGSAHIVSELSYLADRFYLIAPDLPGQSVKGIPVNLPYSDGSHARWLQEILDRFGIKQIHLFGISIGGFVARQYASANPDKVTSLILLVPAGIVQGSLLIGFSKMILPMILYRSHPNEKHLKKLVSNLITTWDDDWAHYLGDSFMDFKINLKIPPVATDQELNSLTMPCLVIGAEDDISFPGRELIRRAKSMIPNLETELLENSKHSPPTTDEFRKWLSERVTQFIFQN